MEEKMISPPQKTSDPHLFQSFLDVIKELLRRFSRDKLTQVGGTLAYFFLLSIFPFFIFLNALLGFMNIPIGQITGDLAHVAPDEVMVLLNSYLDSVVNVKNTGLLSIGLIAALFSASKAIGILISVLNTAYDTQENRHFVVVKLLSIFFTFTLGLAIVTMLTLPALGRNVMTTVADFFHISLNLVDTWVYVRWIIVFGVLFLTIALLYHFGPSDKSPFRKAIPGTIFTALSWSLISVGFGIYVNNFGNYSAVYGSIGAIIVLMIWFYLTGIILMLGGELNQILFERTYQQKKAEEELLPGSDEYLDKQFQAVKENLLQTDMD